MERVVTRAIILDEDMNVLMGKRADDPGKNKWALVGGKPDGDEHLYEAIVREVAEELGMEFVGVKFHSAIRNNNWRTYFFTGQIVGQTSFDPKEILEVRYVSREELSQLDIAFDHKEILEDFFRFVE
jgi:8-oxo-dGTP diphosphatase